MYHFGKVDQGHEIGAVLYVAAAARICGSGGCSCKRGVVRDPWRAVIARF